MWYVNYISKKDMLIVIIGYVKLAKGIFALDGKDGEISTQKNLDRSKR